mgnify:CR=1 FL=1
MKTSLNIPDDRMDALLEATAAKTRTEAVNRAIEAFIHQENVKRVMALAGTGGFISREELIKERELETEERAS